MNPPRRLRGAFGMCNLREGFVEASWRLREGFAKASRRRHGRLHLETIRQMMASPREVGTAINTASRENMVNCIMKDEGMRKRATYCSCCGVITPPSPFNTRSVRVLTTPAHLFFLRKKIPASHRARGGTPTSVFRWAQIVWAGKSQGYSWSDIR